MRIRDLMYKRSIRLKDVIHEEHRGITGVKVRDKISIAGGNAI
jgi:hypothetical protein